MDTTVSRTANDSKATPKTTQAATIIFLTFVSALGGLGSRDCDMLCLDYDGGGLA
ncbi:MAG: hypothetical protein IM671_13365 [Phenylobacterium sp.]|uniref:hypothetical protein n=1 Tax=Phenylobacterium sp. TaxID=1871053 RepID=UPI0025EDFE49|nr:hypothetical protein [Phenylobacterium sp.]MCA3738108.1 hypothetical protein [Phenylobacterium sp.]MCA4915010.1 hypothetical protein [Phenylobacterium sp.]MCA6230511.1 hypothetical protein [Phenylobacterium sp.]MCA6247696.1 hypothetical protein [Phenylobacterium sp.]MCA6254513.1 hypothetical protein [Phenylobacterium sp.]